MRNGDREKAMWNVDMALSLQPRFEEAIRLKERLTDRAYWSDQGQVSSVHHIIQRMILAELGHPAEIGISPGKPRDANELPEEVRRALGIEQRLEEPLPEPMPESMKPVSLIDLADDEAAEQPAAVRIEEGPSEALNEEESAIETP